MPWHSFFARTRSLLIVAATLMFGAVSCDPSLPTLIPTLAVPTTGVTRSATNPPTITSTHTFTPSSTYTITPTFTETPTFTVTPTFTITSTITRTPTITPTPAPPVVTILEHVACNFGPGGAYLWKYGIAATAWMQVIGQIQDGSWLLVEELYIKDKNPCWVKTEFTRFNDGGDVTTHDIPVVDPDIILYFSTTGFYRPPTGIQAFRKGDKVSIDWNAVWMTEDDYNGYLIEAWLCQGGQQIFKPIKYYTSVNQNSGTLYLIPLTDEPGCSQPSHARIYTVEKHGYTGYIDIPWPPYDQSVPSFTPTP